MILASISIVCSMRSNLNVGFCESDGTGFSGVQPADQIERWSLPQDNGSHLLIDWRPHRSVCGRNVSSYIVDVQTSIPLLNMFVGTFGSFPQDLCDPDGSKARNAVNVEETSPGTCVPYRPRCTSPLQRTSFEVPGILRRLILLDIEVTVRAYGSHAPLGASEQNQSCTWWCHKYRRSTTSSDAKQFVTLPLEPPESSTLWRWLQLITNATSAVFNGVEAQEGDKSNASLEAVDTRSAPLEASSPFAPVLVALQAFPRKLRGLPAEVAALARFWQVYFQR